MLGSTFKLGFDSSMVSRGLGQLSKKLAGFGKEIGIGAARRVGERMTDTLGQVLSYLPDAAKEFADWSGEMVDMNDQTGASIETLNELTEALRLCGMETDNTGKILSVMTKNLQKAAADGGPVADALKAIGLDAQAIAGMNIDQQFFEIGKAIAEANKVTKTPITFRSWMGDTTKIVETKDTLKDMELITSSIFGAKAGFKLIRFFRNFDANMGQAKNNVKNLNSIIGGDLLQNVDTLGDSLGRWSILKKEAMASLFKQFDRIQGFKSLGDKIFDNIDMTKMDSFFESIGSLLQRNIEAALGQDFQQSIGDIFRTLGKYIGEGIKAELSPGGMLKGLFGGSDKQASNDRGIDVLKSSMDQQTSVLLQIKERVGIPKWA